MVTRAEIITRYEDDPQYADLTRQVGKNIIALTADERVALFEQWADAALLADNRSAEDAAKHDLRRQVRRELTSLATDILRLDDEQDMTVEQMRPIVLRLARIEDGLIRALISLDLLESEMT